MGAQVIVRIRPRPRQVPWEELPKHTRSGSVLPWPNAAEAYIACPRAYGPRSSIKVAVVSAITGVYGNGARRVGPLGASA